MTGLEIVAIVSLLTNGVQFYFNGNLKAENDQLDAIAKHCKIEEQDERKREFGAATERELVRQDIERVIARSEFNLRIDPQDSGGPCRDELDRRALSILDEAGRRASEIDKLRMRSSGTTDGGS